MGNKLFGEKEEVKDNEREGESLIIEEHISTHIIEEPGLEEPVSTHITEEPRLEEHVSTNIIEEPPNLCLVSNGHGVLSWIQPQVSTNEHNFKEVCDRREHTCI